MAGVQNSVPTWSRYVPYVWSSGVVAGATLLLLAVRSHVNIPTAGFALLLCVVIIAIRYSSVPALLASVLAMLGYNYFFLPPVGTLTFADPRNWVSLAAFSGTPILVAPLSS